MLPVAGTVTIGISDSSSGTAVTRYHGPKFLKPFCERFGLQLFDRVTHLRIGQIDLSKLDLNVFQELELIKGNWPYQLTGSEKEKWKGLDSPLTQKVKETYTKCQLTLDDAPAIKIDKNSSCSLLMPE